MADSTGDQGATVTDEIRKAAFERMTFPDHRAAIVDDLSRIRAWGKCNMMDTHCIAAEANTHEMYALTVFASECGNIHNAGMGIPAALRRDAWLHALSLMASSREVADAE
jgi:hypothetical protein